MTKALTFIITLSSLVVCSSCSTSSKDWNDEMDGMYDCHTTAEKDSAQTYDALVGTYDWRFVRAWGAGYFESDQEYAGWELQLNADGTYEMNANDTASYSGNWAIENSWSTFRLDTEPGLTGTWGEILICDPYLQFNSSPVDGPDHLYEKR